MILTHGANSLPVENGETVTIGGRKYPVHTYNGLTFITENLDLQFDGLTVNPSTTGSPYDSVPSAWYVNWDEATYGWNGTKYGLFYNTTAFIYLNQHASELFPGWHVMNNNELLAIKGSLRTVALKAVGLWPNDSDGYPATNETGFNLKPTGAMDYRDTFNLIGQYADFKVYRNAEIVIRSVSRSNNINTSSNHRAGSPVRLVKDA